jgi:hypothetical protein
MRGGYLLGENNWGVIYIRAYFNLMIGKIASRFMWFCFPTHQHVSPSSEYMIKGLGHK